MLFTLTFIAILSCGLIAGTFFAFSAFVMEALSQLPPSKGIATMQSINRVVINPWFLGVFIGTAAASVFLIINSFVQWYETNAAWMIAGSLFYLIGTFGVTVIFHVPWNDELAKVDIENPESADFWTDYLSKWTAWNHVRTIAALVAAGLLIIALIS